MDAQSKHPACDAITLRDHFATHAPDAPSWFKCEPSRPRPVMPDERLLTTDQRKQLSDWRHEVIDDDALSDEARSYLESIPQYEVDLNTWKDEQAAHSMIQWRWAYADMMLRARQS